MLYLLILLMVVPLTGVTQNIEFFRKLDPQEIIWEKYEPLKTDGKPLINNGASIYIPSLLDVQDEIRRAGLLHLLVDFDTPFQGLVQSVEYYVSYSCVKSQNDTVIASMMWTGPKATGETFGGVPFVPKRGNLNDDHHSTAREIVDMWCYNEHSNRAREWAKLNRDWSEKDPDGWIKRLRKMGEMPGGPGDWPFNTDAKPLAQKRAERMRDEYPETWIPLWQRYPDLYERLLKLLDASDTR